MCSANVFFFMILAIQLLQKQPESEPLPAQEIRRRSTWVNQETAPNETSQDSRVGSSSAPTFSQNQETPLRLLFSQPK